MWDTEVGSMRMSGAGDSDNAMEPYHGTDRSSLSLHVVPVHACCGCCCDMRKAVLIINGILIVVTVLATIYALAAEDHLVQFNRPGNARDVEDFPDEAWSDFVAQSALLKFGIARGFIDMVGFGLAMFGALRFSWKWLVPIMVWSVVASLITLSLTVQFCNDWDKTDAAATMADNDDDWSCRQPPAVYLLNGMIWALWLYPHVVLCRQYQSHRVTRESYSQQKSCCCRCC